MHPFLVTSKGEITPLRLHDTLELGRGGDNTQYFVEIDRGNPPRMIGDQINWCSYRKEVRSGKVFLVLQGEIVHDHEIALLIFASEHYKNSLLVQLGTPEEVLAVEDEDGLKSIVLEMESGDIVEIANGGKSLTINYNLHLGPRIDRAKAFS